MRKSLIIVVATVVILATIAVVVYVRENRKPASEVTPEAPIEEEAAELEEPPNEFDDHLDAAFEELDAFEGGE
jgi:hypothetical protein